MVVVQESKRDLPKIGDRIPVHMFRVSKSNVNVDDEPFGECEEDQQLIANLKAGNKIVQPFKARLEGDGFGVYLGRRRFLAKKEAGANFFVVGDDCLVEEITEEEAEETSWIENCHRKEMNPITRARRLQKIIDRWGGIRPYAYQCGLPPSTLCEYLSVLKLGPRMQRLLAKNVISYRDGKDIARMQLKPEVENKLAEAIEKQGPQALKKLTTKKKESTKHRPTKLAKDQEPHIDTKTYWKKLTESLREFADYWNDFCTIKEWEDDHAYHLTLKVTMQKDGGTNGEESDESNGLEALPEDEAPQVCGACGRDILEGDQFREEDGIYFCRECANKET